MSAAKRAVQLVPSILSADFGCLERELAAAAAAGADRFQVDIMDGHFVPNISMGPMFVAATRRFTTLPIETHLMVSRPEQWVTSCAQAGANVIIVHAEATVHLHSLLASIRKAGAQPAVALNPDSPLALIEEALDQVALVLLMTVEPGFGGQAFISSVLPKIARLRQVLDARGLVCDIEVDGGIEPSTIAEARAAGANIFVAGSAVFGHPQGATAGVNTLRAALG
ncbi:MAG: ribulose-phosphate 3-epimerase [Acidobacteria bacterium]|nr:MAG: ribulose-phosphate 3-epimerase [Acidobacteriota bacterium]